jgi:hypothetical protein
VALNNRSALLGFRFSLVLAAAFAPWSARAGDVTVQLDSGAGFVVKDSTGAIERLRVDEATGNISRNGALFVHTTGTGNLFVGFGAGNISTSGVGGNSAIGTHSLYSNTTGADNTAAGAYALLSNTSGSNNSAFGFVALRDNTSGSNNSAVGMAALASNTTGFSNSAFGFTALGFNTTAKHNSAFGYGALRYNTTGAYNSAFGGSALRGDLLTSGFSNSAFGYSALRNNTAGGSNAAFGNSALENNSTGSSNIAVGYKAGYNQTTGNDNIYLANTGVAAESNTIRIGCPAGLCATGASPHDRAFIAGIRGVTTAAADAIAVLIDSNGQLGTVSSSRSVKKDIRDMGDATDRLLDLRPVTFRYKQGQTLPGGREVPPEYGLIAEEVAEVFPDLVVYDEAGKPFTVKYHELAPMLLNEMKKQQRTIEAQREDAQAQRELLVAQRHEYETQIAVLTKRLARLEEGAYRPE